MSETMKITPSKLVLIVWMLTVLTTYFIGVISDNDFITNIVTVWFTFIFIGAFIVWHNGKEILKTIGLINLAIFLYTAYTSKLIMDKLYIVIIQNTELLTNAEILFAKSALFMCVWIITTAAITQIANGSAWVTEKMNQHNT